MLDLACAVVRVKYLNFNAVEVGVARQRGLAGVAGGCHQNASRLGAAQHLLGLDEQLRHELQGVVLEGAGRAVPQLERIQAVADLDGLARLAAKGSAVGRCRCGVQEISAVIGQKTGQDLFGQLGIGEIFPCVQIGLGEGLRHEQTALRCQTADDSLLCGNAERGISGAQILHTFTPFLLFSFLYMYKPFLALYRCCERRIAGGYGICPYGLQGSMSVIAPESVRLPQGSLPHPLRREPPRRGGQERLNTQTRPGCNAPASRGRRA